MVLFLQRLFYPARTLAAIKRTTGSIQVYIYMYIFIYDYIWLYMIIYDMIYDYKCGNPFWWRRWCKMTCSLLWCGMAKSISQGTWAPKTSCLPNTECDGWWSLQIGNVGSEDWKLSMLSATSEDFHKFQELWEWTNSSRNSKHDPTWEVLIPKWIIQVIFFCCFLPLHPTHIGWPAACTCSLLCCKIEALGMIITC